MHAFGALGVFEHASRQPGFRGGRLLRPLTAGQPFLVIAEWEGPESYEGWLENPVREELRAAIEPLLAGEMTGAVFEIAEARAEL